MQAACGGEAMRDDFLTFMLYEHRTTSGPYFCRRVSGPRRAFSRRSVPKQGGSLRMDRGAKSPLSGERGQGLRVTGVNRSGEHPLKKAPGVCRGFRTRLEVHLENAQTLGHPIVSPNARRAIRENPETCSFDRLSTEAKVDAKSEAPHPTAWPSARWSAPSQEKTRR